MSALLVRDFSKDFLGLITKHNPRLIYVSFIQKNKLQLHSVRANKEETFSYEPLDFNLEGYFEGRTIYSIVTFHTWQSNTW